MKNCTQLWSQRRRRTKDGGHVVLIFVRLSSICSSCASPPPDKRTSVELSNKKQTNQIVQLENEKKKKFTPRVPSKDFELFIQTRFDGQSPVTRHKTFDEDEHEPETILIKTINQNNQNLHSTEAHALGLSFCHLGWCKWTGPR